MSQARKRSSIWMHFCSKGNGNAECNICRSKLSYKGGSTTNLHRHLKNKHQVEVPVAEVRRRRDDQDNDGATASEVEVALEDADSISTVNGAEISCAISGILEAAEEVIVKQRKQKAKSDSSSLRHRSLIWRHFERQENEKCALCLLCLKKIQHNSNTSNLHRHLSKVHPEVTELGQTKLFPSVQESRASEAEKRALERERELIDALRSAQKQEAQALDHQRELLELLRTANAREATAERERLETLRRLQEEEARDLSRQREELQKERAELQMKWDQLNLLSGGQEAD